MKNSDTEKTDVEKQRAKLNSETAKIKWRELQRFFAAGSTVWVDSDINLLDAAEVIYRDDTEQLKRWMDEKRVMAVPDGQAQTWYDLDSTVWAVTVRPWVLVQSADV